mmetsp:Transcript_31645/g.81090  ORF Transcript_31645/g.81090 Transcript_31645/m.81090 type:complete len:243 (-) Transcript_31645:116-844(-)
MLLSGVDGWGHRVCGSGSIGTHSAADLRQRWAHRPGGGLVGVGGGYLLECAGGDGGDSARHLRRAAQRLGIALVAHHCVVSFCVNAAGRVQAVLHRGLPHQAGPCRAQALHAGARELAVAAGGESLLGLVKTGLRDTANPSGTHPRQRPLQLVRPALVGLGGALGVGGAGGRRLGRLSCRHGVESVARERGRGRVLATGVHKGTRMPVAYRWARSGAKKLPAVAAPRLRSLWTGTSVTAILC